MSELKEIGIRWEENGELHFSHVYPKYEADKVIAHQKYKRCLAMAMFCHVSSVLCEGPDSLFYRRWFHKWHELAEKFKEAK
jgi:hypothetical protein